jgi:hypothetical protein
MKIEDKIILARDLCYRLPYGVYVEDTRCGIRGSLHDLFIYPKYKGNDIDDYIACTGFYHDCYYDDITLFKPYLFPLSSMTEEQEKECQQIKHSYYYDDDSFVLFDWYNKNHFDYRGLIEKVLAIDATNKNIY